MSNLTLQQKERKLWLEREKRIRLSRESFWEYCKTDSPTFYTEDRWHLKLFALVLEGLYRRQLTKQYFWDLCNELAPKWYIDSIDWDRLIPDKVYEKLMSNLPPRIGKSRTLVNFCKWCFGVDKANKVITCSYNDDLATDFSRYTRDGIADEKTYPHEIVHLDIFPECKIKQGNASYQQWALEGQFFNYKGAGVGGSITGKGCNIAIVDDPIKDAETAYNDAALDKIWLWYTGTFMSRLEEGGIEIVNMTRWSKNDICGRVLAGPESGEWFILSMEACYNGENMLCPSLLGKRRYESLKKNMDDAIFQANYHQEPVDVQGRLYKDLKTYIDLPMDSDGNLVTERVIAYTDTADQGSDYLCCIAAHVYKGEAYITDVYYTKDGMETSEPATAKMLVDNNVGQATIESNNGGRGFARNVERLMWDNHKTKKVNIKWFHQSKNKISRILSNATFVMNHIYFPVNWKDRWPEFYDAITSYQREGKNKHDDASDTLTGIGELINSGDFSPRVYDMSEGNVYNDGDGPNYDLWYHRYFGIGYGTTNPFAILEIIAQDGFYYVENEYYYDAQKWNRQKDDSEYVVDVKDFINNRRYSSVIIPDIQSFKIVARKSGLRLRDANDDLLDGIRLVAVLLRAGKLRINSRCVNLLSECTRYVWDSSDTRKPVDMYNYGLNGLRYFCKTIIKAIRG